MPPDAASSYDEVPYPSAPYPYTHPDHLAAIATLFGLHPQSPDAARVLEVGCADCANLIPMALTLPGSSFVGIDLSPRQIAAGRQIVEKLQLNNIELRHADLMEFEAPAESFDYIIAHGVLSWTPTAVQERLLALCRRCLAPQGVAFVSYNVYPGWQQRIIIRQWLLRTMVSVPGGQARADAARQSMRRLHDSLQASDHEVAEPLQHELQTLLEWSDGYLLHDLLELHNQPFTFVEFLNRIEPHHLRFFAEADFATMAGADLPPDLVQRLSRTAATAIGREQLMDLLSKRAFRQSLLCHAALQPADQVTAEAISSLYIVSTLRRSTSDHRSSLRFVNRRGFAIDVERPQIAAVLDRLATYWPKGAYFQDLAEPPNTTADSHHARTSDGAGWQTELAAILLAGFAERAVELHALPPTFSLVSGDFPQASPLARLQASRSALVTSLRHDLVKLSSSEADLLRLLDGTRHRASLTAEFAASNPPASNVAAGATPTATIVNQMLDRFARHALLVSE